MKGTPGWPQCGFSRLVVQILELSGADFHAMDVLTDDELRNGIKIFSDWPTIPQLYIKGEFVGGADIVRSIYESGGSTNTNSSKRKVVRNLVKVVLELPLNYLVLLALNLLFLPFPRSFPTLL